MSKHGLILFLQSLGPMTTAQAEEVADTFTEEIVTKNALLLPAGTVSDCYYFLEDGFLRAYAHDTDGNDITTGFYAAGQVVFEVSSFFTRTPSRESIQALTDCRGWSLTFAQLNGLFHARPEFREFGRALLVRGYTALKDRMLAAVTETAATRYEHLIRSHPAIAQHAPLKHIASYLGITDTSLSRIRRAR